MAVLIDTEGLRHLPRVVACCALASAGAAA